MMDSLSTLGSRWLAVYGLALLQNTAFLALVFLALALLRNAPARLRYMVGLLGLIKLITPPFLTLPGAQDPGPPLAAEGAGGFGLRWLPAQVLSPDLGLSLPSPTTLLFLLWGIGASLSFLLPLVATARLAWRLRTARTIPPESSWGEELGGNISVHRTDKIDLPLTLILFPRRIYVPAAWDSWSDDCRRLFVRHERAHIRRADGVVQLLQIAARALYFFHPLVILLCRRLDEYREMACDDASLHQERSSTTDYARYMVEAAETILLAPACDTASALLRRKNELLKRVDYQMKGGDMRSVSRMRSGWILAALLVFLVSLSWTVPGQAPYAGNDEQEAKQKVAQEKATKKAVAIGLRPDGGMDIDGQSTDLVELGKLFTGLGEGNPEDIVIHLTCDDELPMDELYAFQRLLSEKNLHKVKYMGGNMGDHPLVLPGPDVKDKLEKLDKKDVKAVLVKADGKMMLGKGEIKPEHLTAKLKSMLDENEYLVVTIETDPTTPYKHFLKAFQSVRESGAKRVAVLPPKKVKKVKKTS